MGERDRPGGGFPFIARLTRAHLNFEVKDGTKCRRLPPRKAPTICMTFCGRRRCEKPLVRLEHRTRGIVLQGGIWLQSGKQNSRQDRRPLRPPNAAPGTPLSNGGKNGRYTRRSADRICSHNGRYTPYALRSADRIHSHSGGRSPIPCGLHSQSVGKIILFSSCRSGRYDFSFKV